MENKPNFREKSFNLIAIIFFLLNIFWHPQSAILRTIMGIAWVIVIAYYIISITRWMLRKRKSNPSDQ
ncbi:hypothetical protein FP435_01430 [Lactobacillus sp. PV037]|uniref:hypothetical protein n=1 Tax=unclassified Lactobacillus TaxID=2620435 RepID=UPI0022406B6D|nr:MULTISPECIES: hypothetical protein [unclassified Lactobacillus]QNQ82694.1 hypothetical protein FP433_06380 [Lactobacillus sp. PV012]QNQ83187.1 hypothetical protein FP435_01430 [Lactobacillus sp. PV037]